MSWSDMYPMCSNLIIDANRLTAMQAVILSLVLVPLFGCLVYQLAQNVMLAIEVLSERL